MAETASKRALGRGLSDLIGEIQEAGGSDESTGIYRIVAIDTVTPNPDQPRKHFDDAALDDLSESIRAHGILQPLLVREVSDAAHRYEIIAGERRWRAAQRANLHEIPVLLRILDEKAVLEQAIVENVQRTDLNPLEEANGYQALIERHGYKQEDLAARVGKSRPHISNLLRLLNLPADVQAMLISKELSAGHARALLGAADPTALARHVIEKGLSVRALEAEVKKDAEAKAPSTGRRTSGGDAKSADTVSIEKELSATLSMPVTIADRGARGGELRIHYKTLEDLDEICSRLSQQDGVRFAS